jgi:hypothetical protein
VWSDLNPVRQCCGNDANEYAANRTFNGAVNSPPSATTNACCSAPNQCFTTAGIAGCYGGFENTEALCSNLLDDDCDGLIDRVDASCNADRVSGFLRFRDLSGAIAAPPAPSSVFITVEGQRADQVAQCVQGGQAGICYNVTSPRSGSVRLVTGAFGYEPQNRTVILQTGQSLSGQDFALSALACNADCTNSQGFCDMGCIGQGACQPTGDALRVMQACHPAMSPIGLRAGQEVILDYNATTEQAYVGVCCAVPPSWRDAPRSVVSANPAFGNIDTLVRYTTTVVINGRPYKLVINTW